MNEIPASVQMIWGVTAFLDGVLLVLLLYRKNYMAFPAFFVYVLFDFLQCLVLYASYRIWGFGSPVSRQLGWGTQGVVMTARAAAVAEICQRVLAKYRGVWALAKRLLILTALVVLLYSWAIARGGWQLAVLNGHRGIELAIASVIVVLVMFTRYYGIFVEPPVRVLTIGFFLYSSFFVLNDTILERWMYDYSKGWNLLGTSAFLASMLLWIWGLRERQPAKTLGQKMLPGEIYDAAAPEINDRLRALNEHLEQFWNVERKQP
ncbi:MAG TPA: hypothetical protein VIX11_05430 [Candidatus Acidoferrum sp.]